VLKRAIREAESGDTIQIAGRCVGTFRISGKELRLLGVRHPGLGRPTLDGGGLGTVLTVAGEEPADVTLKDLLITGGAATQGGGIVVGPGADLDLRLKLGGTTMVRGNSSTNEGGGLMNNGGFIRLSDRASVSRNVAGDGITPSGSGGGVYNGGTIILEDQSTVLRNDATHDGGGIANAGILHLRDSAAVSFNEAGGLGGGVVAASSGPFTLSSDSLVEGNSASAGGGIYVGGNSPIGAVAGLNVRDNTPDDIAP
jgi:hypothetical protein